MPCKLKMTSEKKRLLLEKITSSENIESGASCFFVPISKTVGAKFYMSKANRDFSHRNQRLAHGMGIGPDTGDKFDIMLPQFDWVDKLMWD